MSARVANRRLRLLLAVFVLAFGVAFLRAAWLQGVRASSFGRLASSQHSEEVTIPAARGTLYDRGGVQLAIGEQATTVYADPRRVTDPRKEAEVVATTLRLAQDQVYTALADRTRGFVYVARKAAPTLAAKLARKGLPGLGFYPEERRFYPQFNLASQVLGYAGVDNHGLAGLELSLDAQLAGRPGRERIVKDASGQAIDTITSRAERDGEDVYLTLDHTIQANAQAVLRDTVRKWHAKSATAIVLDPATGAVRAMAVAPGFDANEYPKVWRVLQRNRAVTDTYEPGSTFKLVTVAGALSERLVSPTTRFTLPYEIHVADRVIHDAEPRGTETMGDTGSMAIGGALATFAIFTKTIFLLLLIGGIFALEALTVIIQVFTFKYLNRRVFLMAPIHHHFEMKAWSETKIMVRFWIVTGILCAIGFALYYRYFTGFR